MKRSIEFSDAMYAQLQALAEQNDVPVSTIIKMACAEYLHKAQKVKRQYVETDDRVYNEIYNWAYNDEYPKVLKDVGDPSEARKITRDNIKDTVNDAMQEYRKDGFRRDLI